MLVPTMLARIVDELEAGNAAVPTSLRTLSYGGAKMTPSVWSGRWRCCPRSDS